MALLAIGANAALDLRTSEATKVVPTQETASAIQLALIIGNGNYPDAAEPLNQPINDASGLAYAMRRHGFDVDVVEDATKADMARAVERLKSRIKPGSVVMLFFGGYGVQSRHETYMIPTDAVIWKEGDVRHEGMSVETVLHAIKERGARASSECATCDTIASYVAADTSIPPNCSASDTTPTCSEVHSRISTRSPPVACVRADRAR